MYIVIDLKQCEHVGKSGRGKLKVAKSKLETIFYNKENELNLKLYFTYVVICFHKLQLSTPLSLFVSYTMTLCSLGDSRVMYLSSADFLVYNKFIL